MASINESNVTSLYFKSSTTRYRMFMHASMNNLFSLCVPIWRTFFLFFFFTRWNVVIKKREERRELEEIRFVVSYINSTYLGTYWQVPWDIYPIYNDIDPSIVRIAFYLSFIFKSVIQAFFAIFFFLYLYSKNIPEYFKHWYIDRLSGNQLQHND